MTGRGAENIALKTYCVPALSLVLSVLQTLCYLILSQLCWLT